MAKPIFIVSTGRCGSTMLSNMVRRHPTLLSVSEFFTSLSSRAFRGEAETGERMFHRLNTLSPGGQALLKNDLRVDEFLYPLGPDARYSPEAVPPIMCTTIPHLTDDHEAVWDALAADLRQRPTASLGDHYRFVFDWLAERFEKQAWLERSGASLLYVPTLAKYYPDALFVHIYRDGRDTALSMQRHHFFRLRVQAAEQMRLVGMNPFSPFNLPGTSPWMPFFEGLRFKFFSADRYRNTEIDSAAFGRFWSDMILQGLEYLEAIPSERVLSMRYETVLASPREELTRFLDFIGPEFSDDGWLNEVSAMPKIKPPSWQRLDDEEHGRLAAACEPGQRVLGYLD